MSNDFHFDNMESLKLFEKAALHGNTDDMNTYIASFIMPELVRGNPGLRFQSRSSIHGTMMRLMSDSEE